MCHLRNGIAAISTSRSVVIVCLPSMISIISLCHFIVSILVHPSVICSDIFRLLVTNTETKTEIIMNNTKTKTK